MGLKPKYIYLDSCLVIYLIEEHLIFAPLLEKCIANAPDLIFVISGLTEMECLVMPLRNNNQPLLIKFHEWFKQTEIVSLEKEIYHQAARLRADFPSLKTPGALHLATAIFYNCDEFWTNDDRLNKIAPSLVKRVL